MPDVAETASPAQPFAPGDAGCVALTRRDRTIGARATDQYEWMDSACQLRTASMVRTDAKGPHAIEFSYALPNGRRVVSASPEYGSVLPAGGIGYVVSHLANGEIAKRHGEDDSPLGSALANTSRTLFQGAHHAIHEVKLNYPRWGVSAGADVRYDMPVTIYWLYRTGSDAPTYAITFDLSAAPANAVRADMRAPYGAMNFDGAALGVVGDTVGGVSWGDTHVFTSLATNGLTLDSAWAWTAANKGPAFNTMWTQGVDAEMGIVATHVLREMDAGGYTNGPSGRGSSSALGSRCASDAGLSNTAHLMPCASSWSFQSVNWSFWDASGKPAIATPTHGKRLAWGSDWGTLGQTSVTTANGNRVPGYPRVSYSTFIAFDLHSRAHGQARAASDDERGDAYFGSDGQRACVGSGRRGSQRSHGL